MISIIVCSYNPNVVILKQCLESIKLAVVGILDFELIIVDNNSHVPISNNEGIKDCLLQCNARLIIEPMQGLTPARLCGIKNSRGELLLFIDDDNFIHKDYIRNGLDCSIEYPLIGAFGGAVSLVFDCSPPKWTQRYWGMLAYREVQNARWSNLYNSHDAAPNGAGMFVRREVADYYLKLHDCGNRPIQLDRNGDDLLSGGDNDLAYCSIDIGFGMGLFPQLKLDHFIDEKRLDLHYLLRLAKGIAASSVILGYYRGFAQDVKLNFIKSFLMFGYRLLFLKSIERKFVKAEINGRKLGLTIINKYLN